MGEQFFQSQFTQVGSPDDVTNVNAGNTNQALGDIGNTRNFLQQLLGGATGSLESMDPSSAVNAFTGTGGAGESLLGLVSGATSPFEQGFQAINQRAADQAMSTLGGQFSQLGAFNSGAHEQARARAVGDIFANSAQQVRGQGLQLANTVLGGGLGSLTQLGGAQIGAQAGLAGSAIGGITGLTGQQAGLSSPEFFQPTNVQEPSDFDRSLQILGTAFQAIGAFT